MSNRSRKIPTEPCETVITQLNHEGRGVAHINGKTTFIFGALPDETVQFQYTSCHSKFDEGNTIAVSNPSANRITPRCQHFGICGGCSLQHVSPDAQRAHKQHVLLEHFQHQAHCQPQEMLAPIFSESFGYRRRARLSVKWVFKKNKVLVGFRERQSSFVADIKQCETLHPSVGYKIQAISTCFMSLENKSTIPQIEVSIGDTITALIVRHMTPFADQDIEKLITMAEANQFYLYLQPKGNDSIHCIYPNDPEKLFYDIPAENIRVYLKPGQFTQINHTVNLKMIAQAITLLDLQPQDHVLDLFCGIGNFSLPIAKYCDQIVGVEGSQDAILQAQENALKNAIFNALFYMNDLSKSLDHCKWVDAQYDKILLDPPRAGAAEIIPYFKIWKPQRIVYISCNPITLARDAAHLLQLGYRLEKAGVMDMFPHTEHIEAMALFVR